MASSVRSASSYQNLYSNGAPLATAETFVCPQRDLQFRGKVDIESKVLPLSTIMLIDRNSLHKEIIVNFPLTGANEESDYPTHENPGRVPKIIIPDPSTCVGAQIKLTIIGDRFSTVNILTDTATSLDNFHIMDFTQTLGIVKQGSNDITYHQIGESLLIDLTKDAGGDAVDTNTYGVARIQKILRLFSVGSSWYVFGEGHWKSCLMYGVARPSLVGNDVLA
jgi:hypothetical protein